MKDFLNAICALLLMVALSACDQEQYANRGFSLPAGDAENGEILFLEFHCIQCHTLAGTEFVGDEWKLREDGGIAVELGGESTRVQTYGDLVTSIINPSHRIAEGFPVDELVEDGESKMEYYNEAMTVTELVDLVTFLKSKYTIKEYPITAYPFYEAGW